MFTTIVESPVVERTLCLVSRPVTAWTLFLVCVELCGRMDITVCLMYIQYVEACGRTDITSIVCRDLW